MTEDEMTTFVLPGNTYIFAQDLGKRLLNAGYFVRANVNRRGEFEMTTNAPKSIIAAQMRRVAA